ncbi:unnamed protein product [Phaeothamnion confervicola]
MRFSVLHPLRPFNFLQPHAKFRGQTMHLVFGAEHHTGDEHAADLEVTISFRDAPDGDPRPAITVYEGPPDPSYQEACRIEVPYASFLLIYAGKAKARDILQLIREHTLKVVGWSSMMLFARSFEYRKDTWDRFYEAKARGEGVALPFIDAGGRKVLCTSAAFRRAEDPVREERDDGAAGDAAAAKTAVAALTAAATAGGGLATSTTGTIATWDANAYCLLCGHGTSLCRPPSSPPSPMSPSELSGRSGTMDCVRSSLLVALEGLPHAPRGLLHVPAKSLLQLSPSWLHPWTATAARCFHGLLRPRSTAPCASPGHFPFIVTLRDPSVKTAAGAAAVAAGAAATAAATAAAMVAAAAAAARRVTTTATVTARQSASWNVPQEQGWTEACCNFGDWHFMGAALRDEWHGAALSAAFESGGPGPHHIPALSDLGAVIRLRHGLTTYASF